MGHFVQLSGDSLAEIKADDMSLITHFYLRAKIRRIDVCLDVIDHKLSLNEIRRQIVAGKAITRAREFPTRGDARYPAGTVYAGMKSGDVYTKIYDKAKEQKQDGADWKRIETTYQGDRAIPASKQYLSGVGIVGLIKGHFDLPDYPKWKKIMSEEPKHVKADKKTESKTAEWLLNAAAHTLAMYCASKGGMEFKNRFDDEFYQVYNDLMGLNPDGTKIVTTDN
jgi:DNA relaxase NicK